MMRTSWRWIVAALALAAIGWALWQLATNDVLLGPEMASRQLVLPALSLALVVLVLGLAGVLIRNLVRLVIERKRGILGAQLRTKLVFFFLALVLIPATVLFIGAAKVITETVEHVLQTRGPAEELMQESWEMLEQWSGSIERRASATATALATTVEADRLLDPERRAALERRLGETRAHEAFTFIEIVAPAGRLGQSSDAVIDDATRKIVDELGRRTLAEHRSARAIERLGERLLVQAAAPVPGRDAAVVVGVIVPAQMAGNWQRLDAARQAYLKFRIERRELVRFYLTLIGLIFLATLFVATWMGLYVARRMTGPIQELATAAREISGGNLDVRVRTRVGDELGMLVEAFNEMAAELQENREVIVRSTVDLRRSNAALEERRRYIETLVLNLSTGVISLDPAGVVTMVNPAVQRLVGSSIVPGIELARALHAAGLDALGEIAGRAPELERETRRQEIELVARGRSVTLSVQVSPLFGAAGERLGTLLMLEDLTDLLRAQRAMAWQEVARRMAHEIKNPLTPIQLAAQRLRKKALENAPDLPDVLRESTDAIEREVGGLKRLVDEFSRYARMPELTVREVDIGDIVESALALYRGVTDIDWEVDVDERIGPVHVDPEQMRRAMINIIDNAVSAMNGRGRIRVAVGDGGDDRVRIEIADTGPGIPSTDRERLFEPYFSTKPRGTGLGLAIVQRVVRDHHGTIRVEDNRPSGARFVIELPSGPSSGG